MQLDAIGNLDISVIKGIAWSHAIQYETGTLIYKPITGIALTAPIRVTSVAHGIPDGWRCAISGVKGAHQANARSTPPADNDFEIVTVIDADHVDFNDINASSFSDYQSGGILQYFAPADLSVYSGGVFTILDKVTGAELYTGATVTLDNTIKQITVTITEAAIAAFTFTDAIYILKLTTGSAYIGLLTGRFVVEMIP